jgi:nicotinate dehydrogenase subunit B
VTWTKPVDPLPDQAQLYDYLRTAPALAHKDEFVKGDVAPAYPTPPKPSPPPMNGHSRATPAWAAPAPWRTSGRTASVSGPARRSRITRSRVSPSCWACRWRRCRAIWTRGPGSYGRNDAGDAAMDAAYLSHAVGRPVRVQYMRDQGTGWDPKGPPSVHLCSAAIDAQGQVVGFRFVSRGISRIDITPNESDPRDTLAGQLLGRGQNANQAFGAPTETYMFDHQQRRWETVAPLVQNASPLRTSHLRDPVGPQINFASESFIDELAAAIGTDPVAFRLRYLTDARAVAVIKAAAEKFGWQPRSEFPRRPTGPGEIVRGRGMALAQRSDTLCAAMVEIEVNRTTGDVRPVRWAVAHDCGLIINPHNLMLTIEGNIIQGSSRALMEEVTYDRNMVTSLDWTSYPILDITQVPDRIDIVTINRPELPAAGAGEASTRPVAAAIGNAIFDATGIRLRRAPFTPERVKAAFA